MYVCMYVCLYVSVCVCMCLYVPVCVGMCLYVSVCGSNQGGSFYLFEDKVVEQMSGAPATRQWAPKSAGQMMADDEEAQLAMETQTETRQRTPVKTPPNREAKKQNTTKEEEPEKMEGPEEAEKFELNFELVALKDDLQVIHNKLKG